jgi:hypothetical protein
MPVDATTPSACTAATVAPLLDMQSPIVFGLLALL